MSCHITGRCAKQESCHVMSHHWQVRAKQVSWHVTAHHWQVRAKQVSWHVMSHHWQVRPKQLWWPCRLIDADNQAWARTRARVRSMS